MAVYLIHFDRPLGDLDNPRGQAQHYIGYAKDVERRIAHHRDGSGAAIFRALAQRGIGWQVVRVWPEGDRALERKLKAAHKARRFCPICNPK